MPQSVVDPLRAFIGAGAAVVILVGFEAVEFPDMPVVWLREPPGGLYTISAPLIHREKWGRENRNAPYANNVVKEVHRVPTEGIEVGFKAHLRKSVGGFIMSQVVTV